MMLGTATYGKWLKVGVVTRMLVVEESSGLTSTLIVLH